MAAIVGGHFLPYAWIDKSNLYVVMGVVVAIAPYALYMSLGGASFYLVVLWWVAPCSASRSC